MSRFPQIILFFMLFQLFAIGFRIQAQTDSLPKFYLNERNGYVIIGWNNPFPELTQLIIQRSTDSLTSFRSIMSMPDPAAVSNGYVDKKGGTGSMYYRIFFVMPGGRYIFTEAKKPIQSVIANQIANSNKGDSLNLGSNKTALTENAGAEKRVALIEAVGRKNDKDLKDKTNASAKIDSPESITSFQPSAFIFSNEEGNLVLLLPEAEKRHYHLHVFKEDGSAVFKMKNIKERHLFVDRSNFYQSGWFRFELYDGEQLREKNRFFIQPEGR